MRVAAPRCSTGAEPAATRSTWMFLPASAGAAAPSRPTTVAEAARATAVEWVRVRSGSDCPPGAVQTWRIALRPPMKWVTGTVR